jgi:hypothetical protein
MSFSLSSVPAKGLHLANMRPFSRLESGTKSGALAGKLFFFDPHANRSGSFFPFIVKISIQSCVVGKFDPLNIIL